MNTTSAVVKIKPGKIQAFKGFEPMSSAILVQRSTNWAYGSLYAIYIYIYIYRYSSLAYKAFAFMSKLSTLLGWVIAASIMHAH